MTNRVSSAVLILAVAIAATTPADAANKEQQQMLADLRILQERSQELHNQLVSDTGTISELLNAVSARINEQTTSNRRALADHKLVMDNLSNDVRVIRERLDDNNVRIGSLTQEVNALRQALQQFGSARLPQNANLDVAGATPGATGTGSGGPPPIAVGMSPQKLWDGAYSDFTAGQWDLAIQGFTMYIKSFPRSDQADNAQVNIGNAYLNDAKSDRAAEAYDKAIRNYPGGDAIPEAYFKKGLALQNLKDLDGARAAWEYTLRTFPESDGGRMSKQRLDSLKRP
jgi:TolA-binding protein